MAPAPEEPRALRQGLLAALLGTGLFFLLLEVLLRLVGYAPEDTPYGYDPDLLGDFLANKRHTALHPPPADHTPYRFDTNAQGLRADRDYAVPKPAGVRRVLLLGDSFTFGPFVDNDRLVGEKLHELLNQQAAADSFEVVSAAMSGWTLLDQTEYLREKGLQLEPDLVVAVGYINDIREFHPFFRTALSRQTYVRQGQSRLFRAQLFLRRHSATYYLLRDLKDTFDIAGAVAALPDTAAHDYRPLWPRYLAEVDTLAAVLHARGIPLLFALIPESAHPTAPDWRALNTATPDSLAARLSGADRAEGNRLLTTNAVLPLLRRELTVRGIPYVDLLDQLARLQIFTADLFLWPRDHHFSPAGHRFLATSLSAYLRRHPLAAP